MTAFHFFSVRRVVCVLRVLVSAFTIAVFGGAAFGAEEGVEFFERKIRPVLVERCSKCHSATSEKLKGGLHADSREGLLKGGDTRAAKIGRASCRERV